MSHHFLDDQCMMWQNHSWVKIHSSSLLTMDFIVIEYKIPWCGFRFVHIYSPLKNYYSLIFHVKKTPSLSIKYFSLQLHVCVKPDFLPIFQLKWHITTHFFFVQKQTRETNCFFFKAEFRKKLQTSKIMPLASVKFCCFGKKSYFLIKIIYVDIWCIYWCYF